MERHIVGKLKKIVSLKSLKYFFENFICGEGNTSLKLPLQRGKFEKYFQISLCKRAVLKRTGVQWVKNNKK